MDILLEYSVYSAFPIISDISGVLKSHSKTTFHSVTAFLILPVHIELVCDYGIPDYGAGYTVGYTEFYCTPSILRNVCINQYKVVISIYAVYPSGHTSTSIYTHQHGEITVYSKISR